MRAFEGTLWRLVRVTTVDGPEVSVPDEVEATARFLDGTVSGSGGCNRYSGGYALDGDRLTVGPARSTLMYCEGARGAVEAVFLGALPQVAAVSVTEGSLVLRDSHGAELLAFAAVDEPSLTGVGWVAVGVNNGTGGVTGVVAGTAPTATFAADGTVSGWAGVNSFHGRFESGAATLAVLGLTTTRMAGEPDAMAQEQQYLAALARSVTWAIDGNRLELRDGAGSLQLQFTLAP